MINQILVLMDLLVKDVFYYLLDKLKLTDVLAMILNKKYYYLVFNYLNSHIKYACVINNISTKHTYSSEIKKIIISVHPYDLSVFNNIKEIFFNLKTFPINVNQLSGGIKKIKIHESLINKKEIKKYIKNKNIELSFIFMHVPHFTSFSPREFILVMKGTN